MQSDFEGSTWADNRHHLSEAVGAAIDKLYYAFKRLQARQYDAPWRDHHV